MAHSWDTEKYIWLIRMHPINMEFKRIAFYRLSPGHLKQCLWQPRWSRKKAGDELKCPWSSSWELTCSQNSEIPQQLPGTPTAPEVHSLVKLSPCWVSCMNLEAKARISWGKCSTQMDPATLLFSKDKTHARACENVDPKEHRALLGLAGASLSVHNVDMTLASEKMWQSQEGQNIMTSHQRCLDQKRNIIVPALPQAPDVEDSLSLSQSTPQPGKHVTLWENHAHSWYQFHQSYLWVMLCIWQLLVAAN